MFLHTKNMDRTRILHGQTGGLTDKVIPIHPQTSFAGGLVIPFLSFFFKRAFLYFKSQTKNKILLHNVEFDKLW